MFFGSHIRLPRLAVQVAFVPTDLAVSLNVPLFRVELKRPSTMTDMDYKKDMDDEVEDLFNLVRAMKEGVAGGIDAVCSGAILSDYQRIRVEHV